MKKLMKRTGIVAVSLLTIGTVALLSFQYGYEQGSAHPMLTVVRGVDNLGGGNNEPADFSLFWDAWKVLKDKYVDSDKLAPQAMVYGAISGLMASTGDPYTVFMPPTDAKSFSQEISGEFGGIGAEIGIRNDQLTVIAPLKGTPAERAGLRAGDIIAKINASSTEGISVEEAVKRIKGPKGSAVTLTVFRKGWTDMKEFKLVRDTIQIPTLDWKMIDANGKEDPNGKILYVRLYNFYEKSPQLFYEAVARSLDKRPQGVVVDLRNNPGGYLEAAVNIAGWFVDRGASVVSEKFQTGTKNEFRAEGTPVFKRIPTVVLINEGSASASEILAGALKDDLNAKLVGKKSFGKGSVQELVQLKGDALMKVTVAHWLTPNGTLIDKNGIAPDVEVGLTEDDFKKGNDPQFAKAIEVVAKEMTNAAMAQR